jgi:SHS2 domain-containing protein
MRFRFVDHTADIEFIAYGKDEGELFSNALAALFETMADTGALSRLDKKRARVTVKEKADSLEDLLWYTLQHTLSITESRRIFAYEVAGIEVGQEAGKFFCNAKIYAKEKKDEYSKLAVKGVSKYGMQITKGKGMEAKVIVDV